MCILQSLPHPPITMTGLNFQTSLELMQDPHSSFRLVATKKHMALLPKYIGDLSRGIREQLDAELNLYSTLLNGVMVAYSNVRRFQEYGTVLGSQACFHLCIQADFIVFQPTAGSILKGVVNKVGQDFVGCLVHGCFNASIPKRSRDGKTLVDESIDIEVGQSFLFQVVKYFANNSLLAIRGKFYEDSFSDYPLLSKKRKVGEMDGSDADDLPTIIHKRRRTSSCSIPVLLDDSNELNESLLKEAKGKKRKRSDSNVLDDTNDLEANLSFSESFSKHNDSAKETPSKKKKKRKRHKADLEEVLMSNADLSMQETSSQVEGSTEDTSDIGSSKKKKKRRKRYKDNEAVEECAETLVSVTETQSEEHSPKKKKKKKKKHKHTDE